MNRRILFVVGQEGSLAYLRPLWERWLGSADAPDWRLSLGSACRKRRAPGELDRLHGLSGSTDTKASLEDALDGWYPDIVVTSASRAAVEDAAFIHARAHGVPIVRFIDTWYRYRDRLCLRDGRFELPDQVLVIDNPAIVQAQQDGIPRDRLTVVGNPAWEAVERLAPADPCETMYVSQPVHRFFGSSLGYTEQQVWSTLLQASRRHPELIRRIHFAPHPADEMAPPPADDLVTVVESGREALALAGTVVGMFSSLLVEAFLAGRRVVSLQPGAIGPDMNAWGRPNGLVPRVTDPDALPAALRAPSVNAHDLREVMKESCSRLESAIRSMVVMQRCDE
jgi:hypothetical protein